MECKNMLLSEAWRKYKSDKKIEGYSLLTLKMYGFQYNLLKRFFSDVTINGFTTENLKQYLIEDGGHLKPSSLGHRIRFIKSLFKWAHEEGHISKNQAAKLKKEDINLTGNSVIVHGKGDKEREVYFNIRCSIWLKRYLEKRNDEEDCLFVTERNPKRRMSVDSLRYVIKHISNRAGFKKNDSPTPITSQLCNTYG